MERMGFKDHSGDAGMGKKGWGLGDGGGEEKGYEE